MKIIKLKPKTATPGLLALLEEKKLIKTLKPPQALLASQAKNGAMRVIYSSRAHLGAHKLICIKKNSSSIKLNFHPDNEEFILLNNCGVKFRPLYVIMGLLKQKELSAKLKKGLLSGNDFIAVRFKLNDPRTCVFTMLGGTVHCEAALPGNGVGPVFFVAEPSKLGLNNFKVEGYKLVVGR